MNEIKRDISATKTTTREKVAVWLDRLDLDKLREIQVKVGAPIAEQIRRLVHAGLEKGRSA